MLSAPQQSLRVLVYADPNSRVEFSHPDRSEIVAEFRNYFGESLEVVPTNAVDVRSGYAFKYRPHVFILPGIIGEKSFYPEHIGAEGNAHIRAFVHDGGIYRGYCAGAFHAAGHIQFLTSGNELKIRYRDETLGLSEAGAYGPLKGYCRPDPQTMMYSPEWHRLDPVTIELNDGTLMNMAYGLGPVFNTNANPDIDVLARYAHVDGKPPAIIQQAYGKGYYTLFGALPQFSSDADPATKPYRPERVRILESALYESRHARGKFSETSMRRIAQHCGLS